MDVRKAYYASKAARDVYVKLPLGDEGNYGKINQWTDIKEFVPSNFKSRKEMIKTGSAGIFSASLELVKEGSISIQQKNLFDNIYIKDK